MSNKSLPIVGIMQALGLMLTLCFYNIYLRAVVQLYDIQPILFTSICLLTCAFIMMLAAGPGRLARETLFSFGTWFYGIVLVGNYITDIFLVQYVSATEANYLYSMTVPASLLFAWLVMKRRPDKHDWSGLPFILIGITIVLLIQPPSTFIPVLVLGLLCAVFEILQFFVAETHRESTIAHEHGNLRDKSRVVGFVTFATSLLFLVMTLAMSALKPALANQGYGFVNSLPDLKHFIHAPTIWSAMIFGLLVLPFLRYFKWTSIYNLKAENVFVFLAFIPATTFVLEYALSFLPWFSFNKATFTGERGFIMLSVAVIMTIGAFLTSRGKLKDADRETGSIKDAVKLLKSGEDRALASGYQPTAPDDYEAASATLEQCGGDANLAARLLEVPVSALEAVLAGEGRQAFHPTVAARVARNFRHNVALADPLTGLQNRLNFMNALRPLLKTKKPLALLFIDLNKFKPVNDTYGHEAGDVVLKTIAQRLLNTAPHGSLVARLGGDEFVITLASNHIKNAPQIAQSIRAAIQEPVLLTSDLPPVELDAAIGKALFPNDAKTPEDLIKAADKNMYKLKKAR